MMPQLHKWRLDGATSLLVRLNKIVFVLCNALSYFRLFMMINRIVCGGVFDAAMPFHRNNRTKYLRPYLASGFTVEQRLLACLSFYQIMFDYCLGLKGRGYFRVKDRIWEAFNESSFALTIEQAVDCLMEGELTLAFLMDEVVLYRVTISVFAGSCIKVPYPRIVFVGGIQGTPNSKELQRAAARLNGEIAPLDMLIIAVRALAQAFGADQIVGVKNSDQISHAYAGDQIFFDYDLFWEGLGGSRNYAGYLLEIDPPDRASLGSSASHRARSKRKRKLKKSIQSMIYARAVQLFSTDPASLAAADQANVLFLQTSNLGSAGIDPEAPQELASSALA